MKEVTRQLGSFPCRECGATLLVHDQERSVVCPFCDTAGKAPKRLVDDLEHGRKLRFDLAREVRAAVDETVASLFEPPELPRPLLYAWGLACAAFFAWAYHHTAGAPAPKHFAQGAAIGFLLGVLPVGWCSQWLANSEVARAVSRADRVLAHAALACPSCGLPTMDPPCPGVFDCVKCSTSLEGNRQLLVTKTGSGTRGRRFRDAAEEALESEEWLKNARFSRNAWALLVGTAGLVVLSVFLAMANVGG